MREETQTSTGEGFAPLFNLPITVRKKYKSEFPDANIRKVRKGGSTPVPKKEAIGPGLSDLTSGAKNVAGAFGDLAKSLFGGGLEAGKKAQYEADLQDDFSQIAKEDPDSYSVIYNKNKQFTVVKADENKVTLKNKEDGNNVTLPYTELKLTLMPDTEQRRVKLPGGPKYYLISDFKAKSPEDYSHTFLTENPNRKKSQEAGTETDITGMELKQALKVLKDENRFYEYKINYNGALYTITGYDNENVDVSIKKNGKDIPYHIPLSKLTNKNLVVQGKTEPKEKTEEPTYTPAEIFQQLNEMKASGEIDKGYWWYQEKAYATVKFDEQSITLRPMTGGKEILISLQEFANAKPEWRPNEDKPEEKTVGGETTTQTPTTAPGIPANAPKQIAGV